MSRRWSGRGTCSRLQLSSGHRRLGRRVFCVIGQLCEPQTLSQNPKPTCTPSTARPIPMLPQQASLARGMLVCCGPPAAARKVAAGRGRLGAVPAPRRLGASAPVVLPPRRPAAASAPGEPFHPAKTFHKGAEQVEWWMLAAVWKPAPAAAAGTTCRFHPGPPPATLPSRAILGTLLTPSLPACRRGGNARRAGCGAGVHLLGHLL